MLTLDYKILSKVLDNRLKKVLPYLVESLSDWLYGRTKHNVKHN